MPIGAPGVEQFRDAIVELRNVHIIAAISPLMEFRAEVIGNDEFKQRGGIDTTTTLHLTTHLQNCDKWRRVVTYSPNGEALDVRIKKAIDPKQLIGGTKLTGQPSDKPLESDLVPFGSDEVQGAPGMMRQLPWCLDGSDIDIPVNSKLNYRNGNGFLLLQAVDAAIVGWTRLESRFATRFITVGDSMRMYGHYVQILDFLRIFGSDENRIDFAAGVRPTEEPRGPGNSPNMASEAAGASGVLAAK